MPGPPQNVSVGRLRGHLKTVLQEPQQRLAHGSQFREFTKNQFDRLLYALIRILLQLLVLCFEYPIGAAETNSPRRAFSTLASTERCLSRSSSYSFRLPFKPNSSRSLLSRGA